MPFPAVEAPTNTRAASEREPSKGDGAPSEPDLLELAQDDPDEVVARMRREWDQSWNDIKNYNEQWKVNLARSEGYIGARLDKIQDKQEAYIPYGSAPSIVGLNKAVRLSRSLGSSIFADPPEPDVVPTAGNDTAADNAEFMERILRDESSEGRLGYVKLCRKAFGIGMNYGSGFVHFYIDPEGRGPEPIQIKAHPDAQTFEDPLLEQAKAAGQPVEPKAPVLRYVREDGTLTDDRNSGPLQHQFLPKLCADLYNGRHVRFLPGTARDLWDATGVLIGGMIPFGNVKAAFTSVAELPDDQLQEIISYRPEKAKDLLPTEQRRYLDQTKIADNSLVFLLLRYQLPTAQTPKGSYLAAVGDSFLAHAGPWWDEAHDCPLDLPLTQLMHYDTEGNPYGAGSMELLGPGNEILALILDAMLEHMDRFGDQKVFVPMTSSLRPEQLEAESHRYVPFTGTIPPAPEEVPDFPIVFEKMYGRISQEMDEESRLGMSGQAMQAPNIKSARHFQANLQQVQVLLSDLRQNMMGGITRGWRIMGQLIRAYYTIPQLLRWEGEDGAYHVREWSGADLIGLADVQIAHGSFSMMLPPQKAALARELFLQDKAIGPTDFQRIVRNQFDPVLALQEDPHFQRVKRQLDRWLEGPPPGWQPPPPQLNPQTGQQTPGQDPHLAAIFQALPTDDEPAVANLRMQELGRVIASAKFARYPVPWQAPLVQAYQQARQAAQVPDAKQAQQMQQQLQEAQQKLQKPNLSFSVKLADMDQQQTATILQQEGVQVPPPSGPQLAGQPVKRRVTRLPDGSMQVEEAK